MSSPRYLFGGGVSDFAIAPPSRSGGFVVSAPNLANGTFWSAQIGGTQYTNLQTTAGMTITTVSTDKDGSLNAFYGPPGVDGGWLDFGGGDRTFIAASQGQDAHVASLIADSTSATAAAVETLLGGDPADLIPQVNARAQLVAPTGTAAANVTTLQAAVDAAAAAGAPLVVRGSFSIAGQISVPSNSDIDFSQARVTQTSDLTPVLVLNDATGVRLSNLRVQGKTTDYVNSSSVYAAAGVRITGASSDVEIAGGSILGMAGAGVYIDSTVSSVKVRNVRMTGPGASYLLNTTYNYSGGIVTLTGATKWQAVGNDISAFAQGIVTGDNMQDVVITGNYIHDIPSQHGIYLETVNGAVISGNIVRSCGLLGMKIQVGATTVNDADAVTISDNVFTNLGAQGILLTNPPGGTPRLRRVSVTGNVIRTAAGNGIEANNCVGLHISDNIVYDVANGVQLSNSSGVEVVDNRINKTVQNGITLTDVQDVIVDTNRISDPASSDNASAEFGIQIAGATSSDITLRNNKTTDSAAHMRYGIYVSAGDQTTMDFVGNYVSGATDYGARLVASSTARSWSGNTLSGSLGSVLNPVPSTTVDPYGGPGSHNLLGANFDPALAVANAAAMTAGVLYLHKVVMPSGGAISKVWFTVGVAGATLTAGQNFVGVYDSSGNLLAQSADLSGTLNSTGIKSISLTAPTPAVAAGGSVHVAILWNGTSSPQIRAISGSASAANVNLTASASRWATAGSALTALPSTLPAMTSLLVSQWVGVS
jgi:hypothetical protein